MNAMYKYRGLMLIALWQTAPPVAKTEDGKLQIGLGYGGSHIEEVFFSGGTDCAGNDNGPLVEHRVAHKPRGFGMSLTKMITKSFRAGAAYNYTTADSSRFEGGQFRGVSALEFKNFGIGTGLVITPQETMPGLYLRAGRLSSAHVRIDLPDVSQPTAATGVGRLGIAYNQTGQGFGAFIGMPICIANCNYPWDGGLRADLRVPTQRSFDLTLSAFRGGSEDVDHWGMGAGIVIKP